MRKKLFFALIALGLLAWLGTKINPAVEKTNPTQAVKQILTPDQLLARMRDFQKPQRFRTRKDVLPEGYAAAMAPVLVDWQASDLTGKNPFVIIHNLNHGGNPVDGTTVFCSARIPLEGIEAAEFTLLPLDHFGPEGMIQHGQLHLVFSKDNPVELLDYAGKETGSDPFLPDLVFSWEAWRSPDEAYNIRTGMDPAAYLLTPRCFSGPTRFLDDALGQRDWFSYRLRLPGGHRGLVELLKTNLALCDGVSRRVMAMIFTRSEQDWVRQAPGANRNPQKTMEQWQDLKKALAPQIDSADTLLNLPAEDLEYQTILRSCATLALYTINVTVDRLVAQGISDGLNQEHRMLPGLGHQEPWMSELADTDLKGIFLRVPSLLNFLKNHPQSLPRNIPGQLEDAGLLEMKNGKVAKLHYKLNGLTPYGPLQDNLIK